MKLQQLFENLRRLHPKHAPTGQMYRSATELKERHKRVSMHVLIVSDENSHMIHEAIFNKDRALSGREWNAWFAKHFDKIYTEAILPGIAVRTHKSWGVVKILGWVAHAQRASKRAKVARKRHQTKRQRRTSGQNNIRRRHRNSRRRAK